MPKKPLCISDEVLFDESGSALPNCVAIVASALAEWPEVVVFTRRPGVSKKELGLAEFVEKEAGRFESAATPLNRRVKFSMKRPEHSVLIARDAINWDGAIPSLRSVGLP